MNNQLDMSLTCVSSGWADCVTCSLYNDMLDCCGRPDDSRCPNVVVIDEDEEE